MRGTGRIVKTYRRNFLIVRHSFTDFRVVFAIKFATGGQDHDGPLERHGRSLVYEVHVQLSGVQEHLVTREPDGAVPPSAHLK